MVLSSKNVITYGQSREAFRLSRGFAVASQVSGGFILASASDAAKYPAIGLVYSVGTQNYTIGVVISGFLELNNWSSVTGTATLVSGHSYYLSNTAGRLVIDGPEAGASYTQAIGRALNPATMQIFGNVSSLPSSGLTITINVAEGLLGAYWTLAFDNGLLTTATHHAAPTADIVLADGSGGFWKLIVNSVGNIGAESNAGPASSDAIIEDSAGGLWKLIVDVNGNRGTEPTTDLASAAIILTDELGGTWQLVVDTNGNLGAMSV